MMYVFFERCDTCTHFHHISVNDIKSVEMLLKYQLGILCVTQLILDATI